MNITMEDAIAAGDGTLHGAIDYWQTRAEQAERERDRLILAVADHVTVRGEYLQRAEQAELERDAYRRQENLAAILNDDTTALMESCAEWCKEVDSLRRQLDECQRERDAYRNRGVEIAAQYRESIEQRDELLAAIQQTLDENSHLADGDDCTLIVLKRALEKVGAGKGETE